MSSIARFLEIQYQIGKVTEAQLQSLIGSRITEEEFNAIIGKENDEQ